MGYYARGGGSAKFKDGVDKEVIRDILDSIIKKNWIDMEYELYDDGVDFWESDDHWHEEDTLDFLSALKPYIIGGSAEYVGEGDENWRYIFIADDNKWIEENGMIYYSYEDMANVLRKNGYEVNKV